MRLTPLDIRKQEFTRGFRGYEPEEVQAFLQMVSSQWEDMLDEQRRLEEKLREYEAKLVHYERVEEALQEALQTARESSRKALDNAEHKARLIIEEAEARATEIKKEAELERHQIKRETAKLSGRRNEIVARLRAFLVSEMELLAHFEGDDPVGFIKLLPMEQHVMRASGERALPAVDRHRGEDASGAWGEAASTDRAGSSSAGGEQPSSGGDPVDDRDRSSDVEPERPSPRVTWQGDAEEDVPETAEAAADASEAAMDGDGEPVPAGTREEVKHGPGWTARTVISTPPSARPPAPAGGSTSEDPRETPDEPAEDASDVEIAKIRRILSDLD